MKEELLELLLPFLVNAEKITFNRLFLLYGTLNAYKATKGHALKSFVGPRLAMIMARMQCGIVFKSVVTFFFQPRVALLFFIGILY